MKPVKLENAALIMDFLPWPRREGRGNARSFLSRPGNAIHTQKTRKGPLAASPLSHGLRRGCLSASLFNQRG
jgi:hypothetical protein